MAAPVSLPREPRRLVLVSVDDWWALAQLPARVVLVADSNLSLVALGLSHMIVDVSYAAPQAHGIVNVALHRE
jgi:hypothetical protein